MAEENIIIIIWNYKIMGIQIIPIIILIVVIYLIIKLIKRLWKGKEPKFIKKEIKKAIKEENNEEVSILGMKANKVLMYGFNTIGFVKEYLKYKSKPTIFKYKGKLRVNPSNQNKIVIGMKVCRNNFIFKFLSNFGIGIKYFFVDEEFITENIDSIIINLNAEHTVINGAVVFSNKAKDIIENISFKVNRENELEEFINYIPKMDYLEQNTSSIIAKWREKALIEKEKYRGQIESAEEG